MVNQETRHPTTKSCATAVMEITRRDGEVIRYGVSSPCKRMTNIRGVLFRNSNEPKTELSISNFKST